MSELQKMQIMLRVQEGGCLTESMKDLVLRCVEEYAKAKVAVSVQERLAVYEVEMREEKKRMQGAMNMIKRALEVIDRVGQCRECKERDNETNPAQYGLCMDHYDEYWPPARIGRPEGETQ